jgi:hypothetical protein
MKQLGNNLQFRFHYGEQGSCSTVLGAYWNRIHADPRKSPVTMENLVDGAIIREGRFLNESPEGL